MKTPEIEKLLGWIILAAYQKELTVLFEGQKADGEMRQRFVNRVEAMNACFL